MDGLDDGRMFVVDGGVGIDRGRVREDTALGCVRGDRHLPDTHSDTTQTNNSHTDLSGTHSANSFVWLQQHGCSGSDPNKVPTAGTLTPNLVKLNGGFVATLPSGLGA